MKKLFLGFLLIFLASCMATPQIQLKSGNMAMEIKQKAPIVNNVDISPDGRYVLSGSFESFILWDILQGEKIQTFTHPGTIRFTTPVSFSPDGKYFASGGEKGIKLWDSTTRQEIMTFGINLAFSDLKTSNIPFSPDGKYFASGGKGTILWDLATRQEVMTFDDNRSVSMAFSPDGKYLLCAPSMKIFDVSTGRKIRDFKIVDSWFIGYKIKYVWSVAYSPDGKYVLSGGDQGKVDLWNTSTGKSVKTVAGSTAIIGRVSAVSFSSDGEYALSGGSDNSVRLWNAKSLTQIKKFVGHTGLSGISSVAFSPDGKYALSAGWDNSIKIWDIASGTEWKALKGHTSMYGVSAKFFPNGKQVISAGDASTRIWDASTGEEVASMIAFEDGEWIITTANGYYSSSPKGDQYLSVKVGGKDYTIEQLREAFYRPDLVKLAMSGGSLKEFKKLADIKEPPVVSIVNTPTSTDKDEIAVTLKIVDSGGGVGDIRLYLNGSAVMLDSSRGVKIVASNQNDVLKTYNLRLSSGLNSIRAIAFNGDNTMQSNDAIHQITASFKTFDKPSLNALIIGINDYKNPKLQLNYAVPDAKLFAEKLKNGASGLFDKVNIKMLLTTEETTSENIIKELKAMRRLHPDDLFVFYVASHGTVDDGEYFLITSNVGSTRTEKLKTDALPQGMLKELIANIPATKKLIIIDTCSAGALGEAIQVAMLTRGMSEDTAMKILSRAVGSTILSASTSIQEALEGYNGHGLFTYVLTEGLSGKADKGKSGYVKTTELADYVDNEVPVLAEKVFKKAQYPTISISGQAFPIGKVK